MARPKIEEIEKLKKIIIRLPDCDAGALAEWINLLLDIREAELEAKNGAGK